MIFKTKELNDYSIIEFELDKPMEPNELKNVKISKINTSKGVILSGRGPIWLYGYLIHQLHIVPFVATYDPRIKGAVILESHNKNYNVGEIINLSLDVQY